MLGGGSPGWVVPRCSLLSAAIWCHLQFDIACWSKYRAVIRKPISPLKCAQPCDPLPLPLPYDPVPAGVMYPAEGPTNKQTGRRVDKFGPLKGFKLDLSGKAAQVGLPQGGGVCLGGVGTSHAQAFRCMGVWG